MIGFSAGIVEEFCNLSFVMVTTTTENSHDVNCEWSVNRPTVPYLDQYFGVWAMHEPTMRAMVDRVEQLDLAVHMATADQQPHVLAASRARYEKVSGGIAVIELHGTLMKQASSMDQSTSTVQARRAIRQAVDDSDVQAILLHIDSPGGTVSGTKDLADDVYAAARKKKVYAYIEDLGASAAYWIASQATKVYANPTAMSGSIGTYAVVYDLSEYAAKEGIKVHVIRAGALKGAGTPGTEITEEQLAEWQTMVDDLNAFFIRGVAKGRKMAIGAVRNIADGKVHVGDKAVPLGLIDGVQTIDETLSQLRGERSDRRASGSLAQPTAKEPNVTDSNQEPRAATIVEIEQACQGADPAFVLDQAKKGATLQAAISAHNENLRAQLEMRDEEIKKLQTAKDTGVPALSESDAAGSADYGDPITKWESLVAEKVTAGYSRMQSVRLVNRKNPGLRQAYVDAKNDLQTA